MRKLKLKIRYKIRDLYKSISDFKKGYQSITNIIKDDKDDLFLDSYSTVARWNNLCSQLLNVLGIRQTDIYTQQNPEFRSLVP